MTQALNERIKKMLSEKKISKTEISKTLGIGYSTLWRRLNGERSIDIDFLMELAKVLGTTVSDLVGESDIVNNNIDNSSVKLIVQTNDPSREIISKPGRLTFRQGEVLIDIPDTPTNKQWFDDFITKVIMQAPVSREPALA